jgi:soluble lytic murein transglycosylase
MSGLKARRRSGYSVPFSRNGKSVRLRFLICLLLLFAPPAPASVASDFLSAREAYQKGRFDRFQNYAARIPADDPLRPYIEYWRMKSGTPGPAELADFIRRFPDGPLANKLRGDLARIYGRAQDWPNFETYFKAIPEPDQELLCFDMRARLQQGDPNIQAAGIALWRTWQDLPSACDPLFDTLAQRGVLNAEERLARLRLALDGGNLRLAREVNGGLPEALRMDPDALDQAARNPAALIEAGSTRPGQREAALYALTTIARQDSDQAARIWEAQGGKYGESEQRYGWGQIALHAARRHDARALDWFARADQLPGAPLSEPQALWKTRAALLAGRWADVYAAILAMPAGLQNEAVWRYWKARALKNLGAPYQANVLFAQLSQEIHYYGLLATEELPTRLEARPQNYLVTPDDLKLAEANPGLQRALLLRDMGLMGDAEAEWRWAIRNMDDRQLLAAAELALRAKWHDRAIITADQTRELHNFDLRYIAPYRDLATAYAQENGLDEAWVYGLIRQESHFVDYAQSGAGARGLMQIMPATARWIAKKLGLGRKEQARVNRPETNLRFGTYYLKRIFDNLDESPVLASAGYNPGPARARRWQAGTPLEGAIYVENIPFAETREYVKKVMANAMFYRQRFGGATRTLKDRLGVVPARADAQASGGMNKSPPSLTQASSTIGAVHQYP